MNWWLTQGVEARAWVIDDGSVLHGRQGSPYGHNRNRMGVDDNRIDNDIEFPKGANLAIGHHVYTSPHVRSCKGVHL
jgi:hypothetical protein